MTPTLTAEDLRALSWLRKEVQRSIETAHKAVQRHLREALALRSAESTNVDPVSLRTARDHLHQAAGALELAGQAEAALLVRAAEQAVHRMVQQPELATGDLALCIERAGFALNDYLDSLIQGKPAHSLGLFQPYRALLAFTDNPRVHPADLWRHDWRWRVIAAESSPPAVPADDSAPEAMERLTLRLMRAPEKASFQRMSDLCAGLGAQAKGRRATLWRLAAAFFEAQAQGLIKSDVYVKRAASRLLAQVRQGLRPSEMSDQLARDLLFFCASAADHDRRQASPRLDAVRTAYALPLGVLPDYDAPSLGRTDPAWLALARKRLNLAREAWSAALAGEPPREGALVASFAVLQESLEKLFPHGQALGQALVRAAQQGSTGKPPPPALGMEVATAILLLEASVDDTEPQPEGLGERVQRLAERVDAACTSGASEELDPWMATTYRRVSDAQTLKSLAGELRSTLSEVERAVDSFVKDPVNAAVLAPVDPQLGSLTGVLSVLNLDDTTRALKCMRDDVHALAQSDLDAPQRQVIFERLADNLGALGFTIDILAVQPDLARSMFQFDEQAHVLRAPPAPPTLSADPLEDTWADSTMATAGPADTAVDIHLPADSPVAPAQADSVPLGVDIALPLLSEALEEPVADDDQAELLAVFVDESGEVFGQAREALTQLDKRVRDVADDVSHMTAIRRAFHTLKGSSRMVGLQDFGEAAWACEQLYNARLAQSVAMTPALRSFTQEALDYLQSWVDALGQGTQPAHQPHAVVASAEALRLRDELMPIHSPSEQPLEAEHRDSDHIKVIGPLRVEIAMFNIFLNEADELARQLSTQLAEWAVEPQAPPGEAIEALAHSLAGSSSAVGHADLAALSRALEYALARSNEVRSVSPDEPALFARAAADINRLLHQFAAGFLATPEADLVDALDQHQPQPPAAVVPDQAFTSPVLSLSEVVQPEPTGAARTPPADLPVVDDELVEPLAQPASLKNLPVLHGVLEPEDDIDSQDDVDLELFANFREEAEELLPQLQARLRDWQAQPDETQSAAACMRTLHTYKGAARLVGAMRQGELAHRLESAVQALLRDAGPQAAAIERLSWRVDLLETEFASLCDRVTVALTAQAEGAPPESATVPDAAHADVPANVIHAPAPVAAGAPADLPVLNWAVPPAFMPAMAIVAPAASPAPIGAEIDWTRFAHEGAVHAKSETLSVPVGLGAVRVKASLLDRLVNQAGETSMARARLETDLAQFKSSLGDLTENLERLRRQLREVEIQAETQISSQLEAVKATSQGFDPLEMDRYTRLQEITRIMAESVNDVATVQRSLKQALQSGEDQVALQGRLLRAMQDDLMRTRMVEFESLADRLYRVVRQGAKDTGKLVRLDIVGGSIELDRSVLERMTAPFEHLVRNCVVHGIESPDRRVAAGKDATGLIEIALAPEGNAVTIVLRDDGAGLDLPAVRQRAIALGLLSPESSADDEHLAALIFAPGVSTAAQVSELAGRGVGLDVVRSEVSALGGRIELSTTPGQGACFRLVLPLTTAVTRVLMLRADQAVVAMPSNLVEAVISESASAVEAAYRQGTLPVGEEPLPFFSLSSLLGGEPVGVIAPGASSIVIARSAAQRLAVHVDEVMGDQEVVVKHLGTQLSRLPGLAGLTLLPSGRVAAIYNLVVLANRYGVEARERVSGLLARLPADGPLVAPKPEAALAPLVLVVDDSLTVRRVTQRLLLRQGYRVSLAKDGLEALDLLAQERPDVVLSDIEMPRMDGFDLVRRMRNKAEWMSLPVVMITSRIAQKHRDLARELGVRHYLGKPYSEEELLSVVATYIHRDTQRLPALVSNL